MLKPTKITTIRHYLTVLGLEHNVSKGNFESWEGRGKFVIICVSESEMPPSAIEVMLRELNESSEAFAKITAVIR
jgi:hypothetical protein